MEPQLTFSALFQEVFKDKMIAAKLFEPYSSGDSVFFMKLFFHMVKTIIYWVDQKFVTSYGKTRTNFLAKPIFYMLKFYIDFE